MGEEKEAKKASIQIKTREETTIRNEGKDEGETSTHIKTEAEMVMRKEGKEEDAKEGSSTIQYQNEELRQ